MVHETGRGGPHGGFAALSWMFSRFANPHWGEALGNLNLFSLFGSVSYGTIETRRGAMVDGHPRRSACR